MRKSLIAATLIAAGVFAWYKFGANQSAGQLGALPATLGVTVKVPVVPSSTEGSPVQVPPMTVAPNANGTAAALLHVRLCHDPFR